MEKKKNLFMTFATILFVMAGIFLLSEPALVSAAELNASSLFLVKGESSSLKVTGAKGKVSWKSTDTKVVTVSSSGKVKAVGYGTAYIRANMGDKYCVCEITVINPAKITIEPSSTTVAVKGPAVYLNPVSDTYKEKDIKRAGLTYEVSGNAVVKVSSTGKITAEKAGAFQINIYMHGKKIQAIKMKAVVFEGMSVTEIRVDTNVETHIDFAAGIKPDCDDVKVSVSNSSIAKAEVGYLAELDSEIDHSNGIYVTGFKEGTCTVSVTLYGVTKDVKVVVGDGLEKLAPLDAIKQNDLTGYTGGALTVLTAIRRFIDENNLLSSSLSDREKVTIIQDYFIKTYSGNLTDPDYHRPIAQVFLKGAGVCASYTETFCFLCECIGIDVYDCGGSADGNVGHGFAPHAWNKVKVDGTWYYIDTYWDAILGSYEYFLSETLWSDHKLDEEGYYKDIIGNEVDGLYSEALE